MLLTTLDGQPLALTDALVKFTYNGDSDLSGSVNIDDYFLIDLANANAVAGGWRSGETISPNRSNGAQAAAMSETGRMARSMPSYCTSGSPPSLARTLGHHSRDHASVAVRACHLDAR